MLHKIRLVCIQTETEYPIAIIRGQYNFHVVVSSSQSHEIIEKVFFMFFIKQKQNISNSHW